MTRQYIKFSELPLSAVFICNGNLYKKRSNRTAAIIRPVCFSGNWVYFGKEALCIVNKHSRLDKNYFK